MGKQDFVNTSYLQSFMKTNTCPRGKKKLDCITSLDIPYLKKKKSKKKSTFVSSKLISHAVSSSDRKKSNPSHEFAGDWKNLLTFPRFDDIETNLRPNRPNDLFYAFCL